MRFLLNKVEAIFELFLRNNPTPETELEYSNHFQLLIAIILSAQATDISVNKATASLFQIIKTPKDMFALGLEELTKYIRSIGLFNSKAKHIIALSKLLVEEYNSTIPNNADMLQKFPGVGKKTANVFLNCAFGEEAIGVDTHVLRVSNRLGLAHSSKPLETEKQLLKTIPKKYLKHAHHWLILHGRYVCKARKPDCESCFLRSYCEYYNVF